MHFIGVGLAFSDSWPEVLQRLKSDLEKISGNIKIREMKFLDFVIPRSKENQFLSIVGNFRGSRLGPKIDIAKKNYLVKKLFQKFDIEPIDQNVPLVSTDCVKEFKRGGNLWMYLHLLGKVKDMNLPSGSEML